MKTLLLLYMGDETVTASAGTERVLTNMANAMVEKGYDVIVATNDKTDAAPYFPFDSRVHCLYLDVDTKKIPFYVKVKREVNRIFPILDKPVEAFAFLAKQYPQWDVWIWGEVKKKDYYQRLCQFIEAQGLTGRIHLAGTTTAVQDELRQADIFAFPSAFEGFPLALTEAMATGLPSVGFRSADAVNELIVDGKNGILCEDGVPAFAQGLERLMKEPALRSAMGRQAVSDMEPYYPEAVWTQWQRLIDEQIQQASRP